MYVLLAGRFLFKPTPQKFADTEYLAQRIEEKLDKLKITDQCKDLLKQLLVLDCKKRIDKVKFFSHPFVKTPPESYKDGTKAKLDKSSKHVNYKEDSDSSMTSSETETVFYSSHQ